MIGLLEFPANKKPWNRVIATKETRDGQASKRRAAPRLAPPHREGYKSLLFVHNVNFSAVQEVKESLRQSTSSGKEGFEFFHSRSGSSIVGLATGSGSGLKDAIDLDEALQKDSNPNPEPKWIRESIHCIDNLLYIYTSGTTGLPKAVIIKHVR